MKLSNLDIELLRILVTAVKSDKSHINHDDFQKHADAHGWAEIHASLNKLKSGGAINRLEPPFSSGADISFVLFPSPNAITLLRDAESALAADAAKQPDVVADVIRWCKSHKATAAIVLIALAIPVINSAVELAEKVISWFSS